jgi:hypothetical protein
MTAASGAPPAADDPLAAFLGYLGRNGFQIGLRELVRANELMLALLTLGRLPADPAQRMALLQPLLCRTAEQQRQFPALLARWAPAAAAPARWRRARRGAAVAQQPELRPWPARLKWGLAALLALLALGLAAGAWQYCDRLGLCPAPAQTAVDTPPAADGGASAPEPAATTRQAQPADPPGHLPTPAETGEAQEGAHTALWLDAVGALAMLTLVVMVGLLWLRRLALQPLRTDARLEQRTLFGPRARLLQKVPPLLRLVSRELRRPRRTDRLELDLPQTIAATVRGGGAFAPRYRARSGTPEYVVLIDQRGPHDQLAQAAEDIAAALDRQGVTLHAWRFNGDPSSCQPLRLDGTTRAGPRRRVRLGELAARSAGQRLLIFADAGQLIDPLTGELREGLEALAAFGATMLFTPLPVPGWGAAEQALGRHSVLVLPLQLSGLASGADWLSSQRALLTLEPDWPSTYPPRLLQHALLWTARGDAPPAAELDGLLFELELYLGPRRFQWLCGCAAFPVPSWPVTLVLAPLFLQPGDDAVTGAVALASLPWFREGSWPGWLRQALQQRLAAAEADAVARELRRRLDAASLGRAPDATAALADVALAPGPLARLRHWRDAWWRRFATDAWVARRSGRLRRDVLFLGFIQRGVAQRLMQRVPEGLRRQVFREGLPLLGLRPWVPATALALAVAGIAVQLPPLRSHVELALGGDEAASELPQVARYAAPNGRAATALAFSPDGVWLAAGFEDGRVVVLRRDGTPELDLAGDRGPVRELRFSPDGQTLLNVHGPEQAAWITTYPRAGATLTSGGATRAGALAFSADGRALAQAVPGQPLRLVPLDTRPVQINGSTVGEPLVLVAGVEAQSWIVSTADERLEQVSLSPSRSQRTRLDVGARGAVSAIAVDRARGRLAVALGKRVRWLPARGGDPGVGFNDLDSPVAQLAFRRDGQTIVASSADGSVALLRTTGSQGARWAGAGAPRRAEFSADGSQVVAFGPTDVQVLPATGGPPLRSVRVRPSDGPVGALSPNGSQLAVVGTDGAVRLLGQRLDVPDTGPWQTAGAASAAAAASAPSAAWPFPAQEVPQALGLSQQAAAASLKRANVAARFTFADNADDYCTGLVIAQRAVAGGGAVLPDQELTVARNEVQFFNLTCRGDVLNLKRGAAARPGFGQLSFTMRATGTAPASAGLQPGQCTWDDRGFRPGEPQDVVIDVAPAQQQALTAALPRADRYVVFRATNRGAQMRAGCATSIGAKPPGPPQAAPATSAIDLVRSFFGPADPAYNLAAAEDLLRRLGGDADLLALALAIAKNESGDLHPRVERPSGLNTSEGGQPFDLYEPAGRYGKSFANTEAGDGARYRGRGILMVVGRANYRRYGGYAGLGDRLVDDPDLLASDDATARAVLVGAVRQAVSKIPRPLDADGARAALRRINGAGTAADRPVAYFEAAKPLAAALAGSGTGGTAPAAKQTDQQTPKKAAK